MYKAELVDEISSSIAVNKKTAKKILESIITVITSGLKKEGKVQVIGFGSFEVRKRAARMGQNPRTGEALKIKARKALVFVPGKMLKDAVQ